MFIIVSFKVLFQLFSNRVKHLLSFEWEDLCTIIDQAVHKELLMLQFPSLFIFLFSLKLSDRFIVIATTGLCTSRRWGGLARSTFSSLLFSFLLVAEVLEVDSESLVEVLRPHLCLIIHWEILQRGIHCTLLPLETILLLYLKQQRGLLVCVEIILKHLSCPIIL
jgi:hypothetical protein